jgi:hypothetical protein
MALVGVAPKDIPDLVQQIHQELQRVQGLLHVSD